MSLHNEAIAARELVEALRSMGEDDEEILATAVEGETDLAEAIDAALARAELDKAFCDGIDLRIQTLQARKERLKHRIGRVRESIADALLLAGIKRLPLATATLSVSEAPPSVIVLDEEQIPDRFWRTETVRRLDRRAISEAIKSGDDVPGATAENVRQRLTIRTK